MKRRVQNLGVSPPERSFRAPNSIGQDLECWSGNHNKNVVDFPAPIRKFCAVKCDRSPYHCDTNNGTHPDIARNRGEVEFGRGHPNGYFDHGALQVLTECWEGGGFARTMPPFNSLEERAHAEAQRRREENVFDFFSAPLRLCVRFFFDSPSL